MYSSQETAPREIVLPQPIEIRPAVREDSIMILRNIGRCHLEEYLDDLEGASADAAIKPPSWDEYRELLDDILEDPDGKDTILVGQTSSGKVVSSLAIREKPESYLKDSIGRLRRGSGKDNPLVVQAWLDMHAQEAGWFTAFYTDPDIQHKGIGKREWADGLQHLVQENKKGVVYYTNRKRGKQFTEKYFPDFILNKSSRRGTMIVYLPLDNPEVQGFMDQWKSIAFS